MVEGGAITASRALKENVVDKVFFFYAPKIIGGEGKNMIEALGITKISQSRKVKDVEVKRLGNDLMVSGYF